VRDPELLRELHGRWRACVICGSTATLSLHHVLKHPKDDVEANLVMLCGDGVRGCHGLIEHHDGPAQRALARYLLGARPDTVAHIAYRLGSMQAAQAWFMRILGD